MFSGSKGDAVTSVAFSRDGKTLAACYYYTGMMRFWDINTGEERAAWPICPPESRLVLHKSRVAFNPTGDVLAVHMREGILFWRYPEMERLGTIPFSSAMPSITPFTFSPDGGQLATLDWHGSVKLWEVPSAIERSVVTAVRTSSWGDLQAGLTATTDVVGTLDPQRSA